MMKRPLWWGLIGFGIGAVGWVIFVVASVVTLGAFRVWANIFGYLALAGILYAIGGEIVRLIIRRRRKHT